MSEARNPIPYTDRESTTAFLGSRKLLELLTKFGCVCRWPDPEKVDELKVEFCPIIRSRTNEEKSIQ
jgi:hypothetical protein